MFLINGSIKCSDIDYGTNAFYIYHNFGFVKSATKSFTFENNGFIEQFRPAYVTFGNNFIKVSLGTYRFNQDGKIHYSFVALNIKDVKTLATTPELYARLKIVEDAILYAKMYVKQVIPGNVEIKSNIEFDTIQGNISPKFYWDTPIRNSEASNSLSGNDTDIKIVGYYYAFNNIPNYIVTSIDSYIKEFSNSSSFSCSCSYSCSCSSSYGNHIYVTFPSSGSYYFHIKAVNSAREMSRDTSHAKVIYNNPPTTPSELEVNGWKYYNGSSNVNIFSWNSSKNSDGDEIHYEMSIYKNDELFYNDYIKALKCQESELYILVNITSDDRFLFGKTNIQIKLGKLLHGRLFVREDSNSYSDSYSYGESNSSSVAIEDGAFVFSDIMSKQRYPNRLYYIYDRKIFNNKAGNYYYVLRGYDWAEQSAWSETCYYDIVHKHVEMYSKMRVGYDYEKDFGINRIFGKLFIRGESLFYGWLYIIPKLIGKMRICKLYEDCPPLYATLKFKYYDTLYGKLNVDTNFSDLYGRLNIAWIPYYSELYSRFMVVENGHAYFEMEFQFRDFHSDGFYGGLYVIANGYDGFNGYLEVIRERMCGKMNIFREFSYDNDYENSKLIGKMVVDNYPPEPKIFCTVGHDWQSESIVTFSWTIEESNVRVIAYEFFISSVPITDFSGISFVRTVNTETTVNLANYNDDSEYYFYLRSVGYNGSYSNTSVYEVKYNNLPSTPSYPMFVNDKECVDNIPVVSRAEYNVFKWPKSSHLDMDTVKYNIQISNKSDFSNIIIDKYDIYNLDTDSFISTSIKYEYSLNNQVYYWRVRAYDRHQFTEYGYVGRFKCNTKPGIPTNLSVSNEV